MQTIARCNRTLRAAAAAGALALTVAACGGGSGGSSGPQTTTYGGVRGVMTKTSANTITVNGTTFDLAAANIVVAGAPSNAAALKDGMVVRVMGSHSGNRSDARHVEAENELRGTVTEVNGTATPPYFMVGAVKVIVQDDTVYDDLTPPSFAAIVPGLRVEVYGQRDANGNVIASRVEGKQSQGSSAPDRDEIRGVITALGAGETPGSGNRFNIGNITITYDAQTVFKPATDCSPATLAVGTEVEAYGQFTSNTTFAAVRIECEDLEDRDHRPGHGQDHEIEGYVTDLDTAAKTFKIGGQLVRYTDATRYKHGTAADLANNVKVEVEGRMDQTTLDAHEIEFKHHRIKFSAIPTAVRPDAIELFGHIVRLNDLTEVRARNASGAWTNSVSDIIANTDRVKVKARLVGGAFVAESVKEESSTNDLDEVQARVVAENETAMTLGLLDPERPINVTFTASTVYEIEDMGRITAAQFFAAVVPASAAQAGTLVNVKGRYAGGTLTASKAEIED